MNSPCSTSTASASSDQGIGALWVGNQAKRYFDLVEADEPVRALRNGRPIAEIQPAARAVPSWKQRAARPVAIRAAEIGRLILEDRGIADALICDTSPQVVQRAVRALEASPLRGMDAIHVGAAVVYAAEIFISADARQCAAAKAAGSRVLRV